MRFSHAGSDLLSSAATSSLKRLPPDGGGGERTGAAFFGGARSFGLRAELRVPMAGREAGVGLALAGFGASLGFRSEMSSGNSFPTFCSAALKAASYSPHGKE
tara:strand:+ start:1035 stop:1343 length:309 start_codon:yes stop_codon:yes gene_type:complete